eukprot:CAMPEP_0119155776 /NCGR_PEP_ID=MMETSP1310-20130426/51921_1 /TAXON_ID=464262 /ORGANISM="Genus nov. species nov., Strain RCC2339" /LENGTH=202 /DNA_ID=CAMNT_0007148381 /DNA_START=419 /DNA_END=1024 /DNA_ORIENTATION=+
MNNVVGGACAILNFLEEGDHLAVVTFDDGQDVVSDLKEVTPLGITILEQKLKLVDEDDASGGSSLHDTIVRSTGVIMEKWRSMRLASQGAAELGVFWLIVMVAGADTCSARSIRDAAEALRALAEVNRQARAPMVRACFLGVGMTDQSHAALEFLATSCGNIATVLRVTKPRAVHPAVVALLNKMSESVNRAPPRVVVQVAG